MSSDAVDSTRVIAPVHDSNAVIHKPNLELTASEPSSIPKVTPVAPSNIPQKFKPSFSPALLIMGIVILLGGIAYIVKLHNEKKKTKSGNVAIPKTPVKNEGPKPIPKKEPESNDGMNEVRKRFFP